MQGSVPPDHDSTMSDFQPEVKTTIDYTTPETPSKTAQDYAKQTLGEIWDDNMKVWVKDETKQDPYGGVYDTDSFATTSEGTELGFSNAAATPATIDNPYPGGTPPGANQLESSGGMYQMESDGGMYDY